MKRMTQILAKISPREPVVTQSHLTVTDLPEDVIYLILSYLDVPSLGTVCQTCRLLKELASADCVWIRHCRRLNPVKDRGGHRFNVRQKEKCRVARNWAEAKCMDFTLIRNPVRLIPWLRYVENQLFLSTKNCIRQFHIQRTGHLSENARRCLRGPTEDVTRFVNKDNLTVCGCRDGSVYCWETKSACPLFNYRVHTSEVHCVDVAKDLVISGSRDTTIQIASMQPDSSKNRVKKTLQTGDRVWCIATDPQGSILASGSSANKDVPPVTIWDISRGEVISHLQSDQKRGAGVLDMKFESPNSLLTCGHDTYLRMWDLRTDTCVAKWEEPFDYVLYCLSTDNSNAMITGTSFYGMTRRWDKRSSKHVQLFFSGSHSSSPVYSLAFDSQRMYVALDMSTNMIDFTVREYNKRTKH